MSINTLKAGFSRLNITPFLGSAILGYFDARNMKGVLDELEINAIAIGCEDTKAIFISVDNPMMPYKDISDDIIRHISEVTGLPCEAIFICVTHIHTGPMWGQGLLAPEWANDENKQLGKEYNIFMKQRLTDAAVMALNDMKSAHLGFAESLAPGISFIRRYRMKDGSLHTNPGINNPDVDTPVGIPDERVHILRFLREDADDILLVNFGTHPDVIGGEYVSADWPGFTRRTIERVLPDVKCAFFNGIEGDVNHINIHPKPLPDSMKDTCVKSRYAHSEFMGQAIAGAILEVFGNMQYVDVDSIRYLRHEINVPANVPGSDTDMEKIRQIHRLHVEGHDDEIPLSGMEKVTVIAEAQRMLALEHGPDYFTMTLSVVAIGNTAIVGFPGEPFSRIGILLKETKGWDTILSCSNTTTAEAYFPTKDAYDEGGYEARSSYFKAGVGELMLNEAISMLNELKQ